MSGGRPNVIGMVNRLAQLEADHHSTGATAWSTPWLAKLLEPGENWPPLRQAESEIDCPGTGLLVGEAVGVEVGVEEASR